MAANDIDSWHKSGEFRNLVNDYHERRARYPPQMTEARATHTEIITSLQKHFQDKKICTKLEFTGSAYEGIKINNDLEFDIMVLLHGGDKLGIENTRPPRAGFQRLKVVEGFVEPLRNISQDGYISSELVVRRFNGELRKALDQLDLRGLDIDRINLRPHGPTAQMDIERKGRVWYSVDMVPAFKVLSSRGLYEYYVAKSFEESTHLEAASDKVRLAWRQSFSLLEKETMNETNRTHECKKECMRVLKSIRRDDNVLKMLQTYFYKTVFLYELDKGLDWGKTQIGIRLVGLLRSLAEFLQRRHLPNYHLREMNLLSSENDAALQNAADRINRLLRSKDRMQQLLKTTGNDLPDLSALRI